MSAQPMPHCGPSGKALLGFLRPWPSDCRAGVDAAEGNPIGLYVIPGGSSGVGFACGCTRKAPMKCGRSGGAPGKFGQGLGFCFCGGGERLGYAYGAS